MTTTLVLVIVIQCSLTYSLTHSLPSLPLSPSLPVPTSLPLPPSLPPSLTTAPTAVCSSGARLKTGVLFSRNSQHHHHPYQHHQHHQRHRNYRNSGHRHHQHHCIVILPVDGLLWLSVLENSTDAAISKIYAKAVTGDNSQERLASTGSNGKS